LSLWPLVFIGLISYSLYLWHWPLLVFARYWTITPLTVWQSSAIVIASFILATLSWRYIEQPFRRKRQAIPRRVLLASAGTAMGLAVAFDVATSTGWPTRFSPEVLAIGNDVRSVANDRMLAICKTQRGKDCVLGAPVPPNYAVWGDSHAAVPAPAIASMAERHGKSVQLHLHTGCPPVIDLVGSGRRFNEKCARKNAETMRALESSSTNRHGHSDFALCGLRQGLHREQVCRDHWPRVHRGRARGGFESPSRRCLIRTSTRRHRQPAARGRQDSGAGLSSARDWLCGAFGSWPTHCAWRRSPKP